MVATGTGEGTLVSPTTLCTVAEAKLYMGKTDSDDDTLLGTIVAAATQKIQRMCGRDFVATDYREWVTGDGQRSIALAHYPIIYVDRIAYGAMGAITASATGFIKATIQVYDSGVRCSTIATDGTAATDNLTFAAYPTTTLLAAAIEALSGWTATADVAWPSADIYRTGGRDCLNQSITLNYPSFDASEYRVDADTGIIAFATNVDSWSGTPRMAVGTYNYLVSYRAGYETIPDDLNQLAREFAAEIFYAASKDPNVSSESLGDYSYTLADQTAFTFGQQARLARWMEIPMGRLAR